MGKVAICFPGQGSQKNMMGWDLYNSQPAYQALLDQAFLVVPELKAIMFSADDPRINNTRYSQVAIYANQVALFNLIKEKLPTTLGFAGFSLGEYSAFACAGLYDYATGLEVVNQRALAMDELGGPGEMYAVIGVVKSELSAIVAEINAALKTKIQIANLNTEKQQVLAGSADDFAQAMERLKASAIRKIIQLKVSGAFHTELFIPAADAFCTQIKGIALNPLTSSVYSNVDGQVLDNRDMYAYFKQHMISGVDFYQEIINMLADGYDTFIEIGEVSVLLSMIKSINRDVKLIHINNLAAIENLEGL